MRVIIIIVSALLFIGQLSIQTGNADKGIPPAYEQVEVLDDYPPPIIELRSFLSFSE
jgi:hypothetical protein